MNPEIRALIAAAGKTVAAHRDLRRAGADGAGEEARARYRKALSDALAELDSAVVAAAKAEKRPNAPIGDWSDILKTAMRGVELIDRVGKGGGAREVGKWIDAEVIDMKKGRSG